MHNGNLTNTFPCEESSRCTSLSLSRFWFATELRNRCRERVESSKFPFQCHPRQRCTQIISRLVVTHQVYRHDFEAIGVLLSQSVPVPLFSQHFLTLSRSAWSSPYLRFGLCDSLQSPWSFLRGRLPHLVISVSKNFMSFPGKSTSQQHLSRV